MLQRRVSQIMPVRCRAQDRAAWRAEAAGLHWGARGVMRGGRIWDMLPGWGWGSFQDQVSPLPCP